MRLETKKYLYDMLRACESFSTHVRLRGNDSEAGLQH